jgi:hypothetical protein
LILHAIIFSNSPVSFIARTPYLRNEEIGIEILLMCPPISKKGRRSDEDFQTDFTGGCTFGFPGFNGQCPRIPESKKP